MNHQQIRDELSKAEQAVEQLKKLLNEPQGIWKPEVGGEYWIPGYPSPLRVSYSADAEDAFWFSIGETFPTKEAAELHVKKLKVIQKLRELAGGFKPDWTEYLGIWGISYDHEDKEWLVLDGGIVQSEFSLPQFPSKEAAEAAITTLGDELNVLLGDA